VRYPYIYESATENVEIRCV